MRILMHKKIIITRRQMHLFPLLSSYLDLISYDSPAHRERLTTNNFISVFLCFTKGHCCKFNTHSSFVPSFQNTPQQLTWQRFRHVLGVQGAKERSASSAAVGIPDCATDDSSLKPKVATEQRHIAKLSGSSSCSFSAYILTRFNWLSSGRKSPPRG